MIDQKLNELQQSEGVCGRPANDESGERQGQQLQQEPFEITEDDEEKYQVSHRIGSYSSELWKRQEKRIGNNNSRTAVKRRTDMAQLANMIEGGGTNG